MANTRSAVPAGSLLGVVQVEVRKWQIDCGARVNARRAELAVVRRDICERIGIEESTLMRIEQGAIPAKDYMKAAIAVVLDTEIEALWPTLRLAGLVAALEAHKVAA